MEKEYAGELQYAEGVAGARFEGAGFGVEVTKEDDWSVVAMLLVLVVGCFFGIKLVNFLFRKWGR